MGSMTTRRSAVHQDLHHMVSTAWIPRAVRCAHCGKLACEEVRERLSEDKVAVRYVCKHCRRPQTRHYHENEIERDAD
jgi:lysyl-tRNA synthetase class I